MRTRINSKAKDVYALFVHGQTYIECIRRWWQSDTFLFNRVKLAFIKCSKNANSQVVTLR